MKLLQVLALASSVSAAAVDLFQRDRIVGCNADNCLGAVVKADASQAAIRMAACSSFVQTHKITSYFYETTSTTSTSTSLTTETVAYFNKRDDGIPAAIPTWAANCKPLTGTPAVVRFSSACSCLFQSASQSPVAMPTVSVTVSYTSSFTETTTVTKTSSTPAPTEVVLKVTNVQSWNADDGEFEPANVEGFYVTERQVDGQPLANRVFYLDESKANAATFYSRELDYFGSTYGRLYLDENAQNDQLSIGAPLDPNGLDPHLGTLTSDKKPFSSNTRRLAWLPLEGGGYGFPEDVLLGIDHPVSFIYYFDGNDGAASGVVLATPNLVPASQPDGVVAWLFDLDIETK
ncbi:hypothetical protein TWF481_005728 [Arthrobotrys musiformis]|uniref:Uncharacterized protein n=1 Tax=Arthrobotrys musiformis TaxID=47236 RepID=A0AAV9WEN3_9PEZI